MAATYPNFAALARSERSGIDYQLRTTLFESLTREGRKHPTARFQAFVGAVRRVLVRA